MALFTALMAASLGMSALAAKKAASDRKNDMLSQKDHMEANKTAAKEAGALKSVKGDTGAVITLGTQDAGLGRTGTDNAQKLKTPRSATGATVGGVSASSIGGL